MRKAEAESAPIIKKPVAFAPKKGRDRKSLKGSIGSVARASHARNALKEMTPTASAPSVMASVQPVSAVRTSPQTSDSAPKETSPTPARAMRVRGPKLSESFGPRTRIDLAGVGLVSLGALSPVWGLVRAAGSGWTEGMTLGARRCGVVSLGAALAWE